MKKIKNIKKMKKITLNSLFSNNRFLLIISVVIAVIFWAAVCISFSPETEIVIEDVPVKIEMENSVPDQYGLQMFGDAEYTVDVKVSGSRYVVGGKLLTADDFNITASTALVTSAGTHSLQIKVSKANESDDFTIEEVSENFINVYFDEYAETQANIAVNVDAVDIVPEGYIAGDEYIMATKSVIVSGPALEISQLDSVIANLRLEDELIESTAFNASLTAIKKDGSALKFVKIDGEQNAVTAVTIPVYQVVTLPVSARFSNSPSNYVSNPISYKCSPEKINIGVLQNGAEWEKLDVGTIDFTQLKPGNNSIKFDIANIENVKAVETTVNSVYVTLSLPDLSSKNFTVLTKNVSVSNAPEGYTLKFNSSSIKDVIVYGSATDLEALNGNDIKVKIDLNGINIKAGFNTVEVALYIKDSESCWVYGKYKISFTAIKEEVSE